MHQSSLSCQQQIDLDSASISQSSTSLADDAHQPNIASEISEPARESAAVSTQQSITLRLTNPSHVYGTASKRNTSMTLASFLPNLSLMLNIESSAPTLGFARITPSRRAPIKSLRRGDESL